MAEACKGKAAHERFHQCWHMAAMTEKGACLIEDANLQAYALQESGEDVHSCHSFQHLTHCHSIVPTLLARVYKLLIMYHALLSAQRRTGKTVLGLRPRLLPASCWLCTLILCKLTCLPAELGELCSAGEQPCSSETVLASCDDTVRSSPIHGAR